MAHSDSRSEMVLTKDWADPEGRCKIVETITKTIGLVEESVPYGTVWACFNGANVVGGGFVWNKLGEPPIHLPLTGVVGVESHAFKLERARGCEEVTCHIGGLCIAEGGLSAFVEGDGTQATANVTISLPDNSPIPLEVEVSPKIPDETEDTASITVHGTLSGSGSATAAGPVGPGVGSGTAGGSGNVDFKWTWRKKGPNKAAEDLSVQIGVTKGCSPAPILRASSNVHIDLSADTWWPRGCGARVNFEHVTIETSCEIECECETASRALRPRGDLGGELAERRQSTTTRQQIAALRVRRRDLTRISFALAAQHAKLVAAAAPYQPDAEIHGALADQVARLAGSTIGEAQWEELDRLRERLSAFPSEPQERLAAVAAVGIKLARVEAQLVLVQTVENALVDGYRLAPEQFAALLTPGERVAKG